MLRLRYESHEGRGGQQVAVLREELADDVDGRIKVAELREDRRRIYVAVGDMSVDIASNDFSGFFQRRKVHRGDRRVQVGPSSGAN